MMNVEPRCPVFGVCGGCSHQDISYEDELALKQEKLKELFAAKPGLGHSLFHSIVPSPEPYHYRHRLDLSLRKCRRDGQVEYEMGFQLHGQSRVVPVDSCAIARTEVSAFLPELKKQAVQKMTEKYKTANLVVRTGDDGRVLWGGIGRRSLDLPPKDYLWTDVLGRRIFYSLENFFQANLFILPELMKKMETLCRFDPETIFIDLYSGVGLFGIFFASRVSRVIMLEECPGSVSLARYNAAWHGFKNVTVTQGRVEDLLPDVLAGAGSGRRIAIVDPPRRGLAEGALKALTGARELEALFYLSCNPDSLARDLDHFLMAGWKVEAIVPFDFFPKTSHLETLVLMKP